MAGGEVKHDYHLVNPSPWPLIGAMAVLVLALLLVLALVLLLALVLVLLVLVLVLLVLVLVLLLALPLERLQDLAGILELVLEVPLVPLAAVD